ncbi:MAG: BlaR1 family beta-lactam sensor/signal transducer [Wujia sp.]
MTDYMIHFIICNFTLCFVLGCLFLLRKPLAKILAVQTRYLVEKLFLFLLIIPLIPFRFLHLPHVLSMFLQDASGIFSKSQMNTIINTATSLSAMEDFSVSVSRHTNPSTGYILFTIWITGMIVLSFFALRSFYHLHIIRKSSVLIENSYIINLYKKYQTEAGLHKTIPLYSTILLQTPMITGVLKPAIYLPKQLILDCNEDELHHILLHEFTHYKQRDCIWNLCMNVLQILYWFNPFVWVTFYFIRIDSEIACDAGVLHMLGSDSAYAYGNTIINLAEKISTTAFPCDQKIIGNTSEIKQRIQGILSYRPATPLKNILNRITFLFVCVIMILFAPHLSIDAHNSNYYQWNDTNKTVNQMDLSSYFSDMTGCFVLYDTSNKIWNIYNMEQAKQRVSPDSTYKIFSALTGLDQNIITPDDSFMKWDCTDYPFDAWEKDQSLYSAMNASVNWYFQSIDSEIGTKKITDYLKKIGYGNACIWGDTSDFWLESSLKISPIEQTEFLTKLAQDELPFSQTTIHAAKDAIYISSSENGDLYGKTGTGRVNDNDINGWFIGYIVSKNQTYVFATNIQSDHDACGSLAADITFSILSDMNIW